MRTQVLGWVLVGVIVLLPVLAGGAFGKPEMGLLFLLAVLGIALGTTLYFLAVWAVVVASHEFGHWLVGKFCGFRFCWVRIGNLELVHMTGGLRLRRVAPEEQKPVGGFIATVPQTPARRY